MTTAKPLTEVSRNGWESVTLPMIRPTGFREYDARWRFPEEINLLGIQALGLGLATQLHEAGLAPVAVALEAGVRRVDESGLGGVGRDHDHAHAEIFEGVLQPSPLLDGQVAIDAALATPACAGVGVGSASHAEVGRVAHQDGADCAHGRGIPGGRVAGSKAASFSRWDWGTVQ